MRSLALLALLCALLFAVPVLVRANANCVALQGVDTDDDCVPDVATEQLDTLTLGPDNCVDVANTDQADTDAERAGGDACDGDLDNDDVDDSTDNCPTVANTDQADTDAERAGGDACDGDLDNDDVDDIEDSCPTVANPVGFTEICGTLSVDPHCNDLQTEDTDNDGTANACDATPYGSNDLTWALRVQVGGLKAVLSPTKNSNDGKQVLRFQEKYKNSVAYVLFTLPAGSEIIADSLIITYPTELASSEPTSPYFNGPRQLESGGLSLKFQTPPSGKQVKIQFTVQSYAGANAPVWDRPAAGTTVQGTFNVAVNTKNTRESTEIWVR